MIRRISTKWVLSVLVAVVGPFVGFAWFVNVKVSARMSGDVVRFHLLSMVADLAERLDEEIEERRGDVAVAAQVNLVSWFVEDLDPDQGIFRASVESLFDALVSERGVYDYVLAIDRAGHAVGTNTIFPDGTSLPPGLLEHLREQDYSENEWFQPALAGETVPIDFHRLDLTSLELGGSGRLAGGWYVGWAERIDRYPADGEPLGVLVALMNWENIQHVLSTYGVRQLVEEEENLVGEDIYRSSYAWLWKSGADIILDHPRRELIGQRVSTLEGGQLSPLVEAALSERWGMYPDYEFEGIEKKAAFRHCLGPEDGGFGWIVGVGVDDADIYAPVRELSNWLLTTSALILSLAILISLFFAHRTTRPIRELEAHTRRVGHGDLEAQLVVRSKDELGQLASSFNRMVGELKENREQLVQAEKDAAWREMARQVAHEIKNPLTPISLSAGLLKRARDEKSPEFDAIFDRTIDMIQRQVGNMREVVRDFYVFAGEHRDPQRVDVGAILGEVLTLSEAWAEERGIRVASLAGEPGAFVHADPDELHRALLNVVSNAIEAMPDGGDLGASIERDGDRVVIEVRDTGSGIPEDVHVRLFEPYFTTRSSGTGLGLAIVRRIVEDLGGSVSLENAPSGRGAVARIVLPRCS